MKLLTLISLCGLIFSTYAYVYSPGAYNASFKQWKHLKLENYSYTVSTPAGQLDITTTTTITVKNGKVVKREFTYDDQTDIQVNEEGEQSWTHYSWVEDTPKKLGSHDEGFIPITLDDVYTQCRQNILIQDPVRYYVEFDTQNNGLISRCTYYPTNESDGADRGVFISSINY